MPEAVNNGVRVQTLNGFGWMVTQVETYEPTGKFIDAAVASNEWSLDIGCAYGVQTEAALEAGARVMANDLDKGHLQILWNKTPAELRANLKVAWGPFPDVELPIEQFGAILAQRVLHFLDGSTLERAARRIAQLLVPGGQVFARVISPYNKIYQSFIPEYERRKQAGERWPGFVPDHSKYTTVKEELEAMGHTQIHLLEPEIFARAFTEAGLIIETCQWCPIPVEWVHLDGRESVVLIARK